ncbi:MAG: DUF6056 family protein [Bacteroidia bacterium]
MGKRYSFLLSLVLGLFLCLFAMLSYYNRIATDDYYFIWDVRNHGIINGVTSQYMEWCGRIAATLSMDIFYRLFDVNPLPYSLLAIASLLLLFFGLAKNLWLVAEKLAIELSAKERMLLAGCMSALLFFLSIDTGESWFWFCSYSTYLWSIIAFVWGVYFLFETRHTLFSYPCIAICFLYIGSASEIYSAIYGLIFTIFLFIQYRKNKKLERKYLFAYSILAISFITFLVAPGNYLRDGLFPERHFLYSFFITAKSLVKFTVLYLPFRLPYILIFALPFLVVGYNTPKLTKEMSFGTFFWRCSFAFAGLLLIFFFLTAYVMVETGPPRVWFLLSFLLTIYCASICFYAGNSLSPSTFFVKLAMYLSTTGGIIAMIWLTTVQQPIASTYSKAWDKRAENLLELNRQLPADTLIRIEPLPPAGMLYSAEIAADTNHFTNRELRLGYNLRYHVAVNR